MDSIEEFESAEQIIKDIEKLQLENQKLRYAIQIMELLKLHNLLELAEESQQ